MKKGARIKLFLLVNVNRLKARVLGVYAVHVAAHNYNHQLNCASICAAFSTIVCQLGVFERSGVLTKLQCAWTRVWHRHWWVSKGTSKEKKSGCFLMTASQEVVTKYVISSWTQSILQPIDALKLLLPLTAKSKYGNTTQQYTMS